VINSSKLFPNDSVVKGYSFLKDGNMSFELGDTEGAVENRRRFCLGLGIDYRSLVCAKQTHGKNVFKATRLDAGKGALPQTPSVPDADAFITADKHVPLGVFTADCLSIILFDPQHEAIGIIHAGWRSSKDEILSKTIAAMHKDYKTDPKDLQVEFGPAIKSCCYNVGSDVASTFPGHIYKRNGLLYFDLVGVNIQQALDQGISASNIIDGSECTSCNQGRFYSYRRLGANCGRMISVVMLK
jgi:YfiH family protein